MCTHGGTRVVHTTCVQVEFTWRGSELAAQTLATAQRLMLNPYRNVRTEVGSCMHLACISLQWHIEQETQRSADAMDCAGDGADAGEGEPVIGAERALRCLTRVADYTAALFAELRADWEAAGGWGAPLVDGEVAQPLSRLRYLMDTVCRWLYEMFRASMAAACTRFLSKLMPIVLLTQASPPAHMRARLRPRGFCVACPLIDLQPMRCRPHANPPLHLRQSCRGLLRAHRSGIGQRRASSAVNAVR